MDEWNLPWPGLWHWRCQHGPKLQSPINRDKESKICPAACWDTSEGHIVPLRTSACFRWFFFTNSMVALTNVAWPSQTVFNLTILLIHPSLGPKLWDCRESLLLVAFQLINWWCNWELAERMEDNNSKRLEFGSHIPKIADLRDLLLHPLNQSICLWVICH